MQICKYSDSLCSVACVNSDITSEGPPALALLNSPQVDIITAWFRYVKLSACWAILPAYSHLLLLFLKKENHRDTIRLDQDQTRRFCPDCLQRLSVDDKSRY